MKHFMLGIAMAAVGGAMIGWGACLLLHNDFDVGYQAAIDDYDMGWAVAPEAAPLDPPPSEGHTVPVEVVDATAMKDTFETDLSEHDILMGMSREGTAAIAVKNRIEAGGGFIKANVPLMREFNEHIRQANKYTDMYNRAHPEKPMKPYYGIDSSYIGMIETGEHSIVVGTEVDTKLMNALINVEVDEPATGPVDAPAGK